MSNNQGSSQWISDNLALAGFTGESAAFMTCKELLENGLDATRNQTSARLELRINTDCPNYVKILCSDNGIGFRGDSVGAISTIFVSARSSASAVTPTTGKFGLGLKAVALTSHKECDGRDVMIRTRGNSSDVVEFCLGVEVDTLVIKNVDVVKPASCDDLSSGFTTSVCAFAPIPTDVDKFLNEICNYTAELVLGTPIITVDLRIDSDPVDTHTSPDSIPKSVTHKDPSMLVHCTISLPKRSESGIHITRFINGAPLITLGCSGCVMIEGVQSTLKKSCSSLGIELASSSTIKSITSHGIDVLSKPQGSTWHSMDIRVFLQIPSIDIEYNSLTKSGVSGIKSTEKSLAPIVARCVKSALKKLQSRFPSQFQSMEDFERKQAVGKYIPVIAHNLTEMIRRLRSEDMRNRLEAFGVNLEERLVEEMVKLVGDKRKKNESEF
jgi:DNA topoisomerase VI subunit B